MAIDRFRQLRVYEKAVALRQRVFTSSREWPREERFALTDQLRRASRSVGANVAEAWAKRRYERHPASAGRTDAFAEAEETSVWLDVALECGYLGGEEHAELRRLCDDLGGGLVRMMQDPEKWCGPAGLVREETAAYDPS